MSGIAGEVNTSISDLTREFETITHNLSNAGTVGFKRKSNAFTLSLDPQIEYSPGSVNPDSPWDFSQGDMVETGRPLDVAIFGKGFFVIETPDGPLYTRNGMFSTDSYGQIVDSMGRLVAGQNGPITIPSNISNLQLHISGDGTISSGTTEVGRFKVVDFAENEGKLVPAGNSCYHMPDVDAEALDAERMVVKQKFQEASNVKVVEELVDMIFVSRLYQANMKSITSQQEASASLMSLAMG